MKSIKYNRLVRDRVPQIITENGGQARTVVLGETEFIQALKDKLVEEAREAAASTSIDDLATEAADLMEVLYSLLQAMDLSPCEVEAVRKKRSVERGKFERRLLLVHATSGQSLPQTSPAPAAGGKYEGEEDVRTLYRLTKQLPRHSWDTPATSLPTNGIYFFYERGEYVQVDDETVDRIVRVGTHNRDGNFRKRIRQHYGSVHSLLGHKNGSVFRKHIGGALLRRDSTDDPRLYEWLRQMGKSYPEVEERVSQTLRTNFTFSYIRVDDADERLALERGLIALLAQHPLGRPTSEWLGRYASNAKIQRSGLWNTQRIDARPLTATEFHRLDEIVASTSAEVSGE